MVTDVSLNGFNNSIGSNAVDGFDSFNGFYRLAEAAAALNVSVSTVGRYLTEARLPHVEQRSRTGHKVQLIPRAAVQRLIAEELNGLTEPPASMAPTPSTPSWHQRL